MKIGWIITYPFFCKTDINNICDDALTRPVHTCGFVKLCQPLCHWMIAPCAILGSFSREMYVCTFHMATHCHVCISVMITIRLMHCLGCRETRISSLYKWGYRKYTKICIIVRLKLRRGANKNMFFLKKCQAFFELYFLIGGPYLVKLWLYRCAMAAQNITINWKCQVGEKI